MIKYKVLKNLLLDFIPETYSISWLKPELNSKGLTGFRFRVFLPERNFDLICNLSDKMLFIASIPEIRILSKDYKKIKEVFDKMKIDYERGAL